jgi:hypothetical protein
MDDQKVKSFTIGVDGGFANFPGGWVLQSVAIQIFNFIDFSPEFDKLVPPIENSRDARKDLYPMTLTECSAPRSMLVWGGTGSIKN